MEIDDAVEDLGFRFFEEQGENETRGLTPL